MIKTTKIIDISIPIAPVTIPAILRPLAVFLQSCIIPKIIANTPQITDINIVRKKIIDTIPNINAAIPNPSVFLH